MQQQLRGGFTKPDHFRTLVRDVVSNSSDPDIWVAVFDIIDNLSALMPPASSIVPTL
ncbi:hypothetical protein F5B17DRAFT_425449 [Nemania serpens]|nr:hypothetical protein F5B17DRAFT_425449 [Nemania serpens]